MTSSLPWYLRAGRVTILAGWSNSGECGGFVFGEVEDGIEADHFQEHHDAFAGGIKRALAAGAFHGGEGAHQRADAGAVEFGDAGEIDGEVGGARIHELLHLVAVSFFGFAQFERPLEIQDGGGAGLADADVHARLCETSFTQGLQV